MLLGRGRRWVVTALTLVAAAGLALALRPAGAEEEAAGEYAEEEMTDCLDCHDQDSKYPVLSILATQHAVKADGRTPLAQQYECQTCHGPSAAHMEDEDVPTSVRFRADLPAGPQNAVCLQCHQGGGRINWQGGSHANSEVACTSCHTIHTQEDPVMVRDRRPDVPAHRPGQAAVCYQCHLDKRADSHKASAHPIRDGILVCSDCHNPHGGMGPSNLTKPTVNETCFQCHAEKRGPFLWEHAPVAENCTNCHEPHGSNHANLLRTRVPLLCQQCHTGGSHPTTPYGGPNYTAPFPGGTPVGARQAFARGCLNCHTEVHGSNHPSGSRWTR
jgi:DmsE family decaheme c-type cytochrome